MSDKDLKIETLVLHGAYEPDPETGATVPPIYQSTSFAADTAEDMENVFAGRKPGYVYSRISNPTLMALERRIAALEGGIGAVACASGMAAISTAVLALTTSGDEIISGNSIFGGTYSLFAHTLSQYKIKTIFVESTDTDAYRQNINDRTKIIFLETIGNPKLDVPRISAIADIAKEHGIVLIVDNTVTTPVLIRPGQFGANIVVHSSSKFLNGHGNAIGGLIVDNGNFDWNNDRYEHLKEMAGRAGNFAFLASLRTRFYRDLGACMAPFNAFLTLSGIESLAVRMERHCENAQVVADFLTSQPAVTSVCYPGLTTHSDHKAATEQFNGKAGSILTLGLETKEKAFSFINGLKLIKKVANLGDAKTLAIHPASTICRDASEAEKEAMGVTDDMIRLSVGLEHSDDILYDIEQSLKTI